jgi:zinc protease
LAAFVLGVCAWLAVARPALASPRPTLPVEEHRLANGLRVVLAPDPSLDDVTVLVRYGVGTADDPARSNGLAHLVEHLMFAGSKHAPPGYFQLIERAGGWNLNATTTLDDTRYFVTVPPEQIPLVFWLESDRMAFLAQHLDEAALQREIALVADEAREKVDDHGLGAVGMTGFSEVFPPWHPYHRAFDAASLAKPSLADVQAFLGTWYTPRNATLIVAGRFDTHAVLALAEHYFGDLPGTAPPERPAIPASNEPDVHVEMRASVIRDYVLVLWPTPPFHAPGDAELDVAATILADPLGRLQRELVEKGLAVHVEARQRSLLRQSAFYVSAVVADGSSTDSVSRVVTRVVRDLARAVQSDECQRAREELGDRMIFRLETSGGRAQQLASAGDRDPWELTTYDKVQPTDVERTLRVMLTYQQTVVVVHHDSHYRPRGVVVDRRTETR